MTPDERPRPQFEPPPWEVEAFERFRQEQEQVRSSEELERALEAVRDTGGQHASPTPAGNSEPLASDPPRPTAAAPPEDSPESPGVSSTPTAVIPEERLEAMFAELRLQEAPAAKVGLTLVYSAVAFMGTTGVFMVIAAIVLFSKSSPAGGPGTIVAALASMVMLLTGAGCVAGAVVLYRKHQ